MADEIQIILSGATGRMGKEFIRAVDQRRTPTERAIILGGLVSEQSAKLGEIVPGIKEPLSADWRDSFGKADVIVDLSTDSGALRALEHSYQRKIPIFLGTSGLPERLEVISAKVATLVPLVRAPGDWTASTEKTLVQFAEESLRVAAWLAAHRRGGGRPGVYPFGSIFNP